MNIFGIGTAELAIIFLLMLMVAGPKRMMQWAYIAGTYVSKLRAMWQETSQIIKKELEQAGIEPEVVDALQEYTKPPGMRKVTVLDKMVDEMKKPIEEAMQPVEGIVREVKDMKTVLPGGKEETPTAEAAAVVSEKPVDDSPSSNVPAGEPQPPDRPASSDSDKSKPDVSGRYDAWTRN